MTYTPIPKGTSDWDVPVNAAFTDQDTRITTNASNITAHTSSISGLRVDVDQVRSSTWIPADYGLISWSIDPSQAANSQVLTSGTIHMVGIKVRSATNLTNAVIVVSTAGSGLTAGQNLVAVYDSLGNRVAQSADQTANWGTTGTKVVPMTGGPVSIPAGTYYVSVLSAGTTPISMPRETSLAANPLNLNLTIGNARGAALAGQTTMPANINPLLRTFETNSYWAGIS